MGVEAGGQGRQAAVRRVPAVTGKPTTIEPLARLMGNTRQVRWDHHVQWCDAYNEALWEVC
jgi:hypothetical protein